MKIITIDEKLEAALQSIAEEKSASLDQVAKEALVAYVDAHSASKRVYSFVGIGHSGKKDLSRRVDFLYYPFFARIQ